MPGESLTKGTIIMKQLKRNLASFTTSTTATAAIIFSLMLNVSAQAEEEALSVSVVRLSSESALIVAKAAMLECRKQGYQATATVVDKNGITQAVVRDTLAPPVSIEISKAKAYTSVNFTADTSSMEALQNTPIGKFEGVLMSAGGVVINVGGIIYGAVGVSGAPSGVTDENCAKAGVAAISEELEMAD